MFKYLNMTIDPPTVQVYLYIYIYMYGMIDSKACSNVSVPLLASFGLRTPAAAMSPKQQREFPKIRGTLFWGP